MAASTDAIKLISARHPQNRKAAFLTVAKHLMENRHERMARKVMESEPDAYVRDFAQKAAAMTLADAWRSGEGESLASAFVESIAPGSILDQLKRFGTVLPNLRHYLIAVGGVGDVHTEGEPKIIRKLILDNARPDFTTAISVVVLTDELVRSLGGLAVLERELGKSVLRSVNGQILTQLIDSNSGMVSATGTPAGDLIAGLAASSASDAYVVVASPGVITALALSDLNKSGAGVTGGELLPGVALVRHEGATGMTIFAASHIAVLDKGLTLHPTGEAAVNLSDSPEAPSQLVSLWQTDCVGLLAERTFAVSASGSAVVVVQ